MQLNHVNIVQFIELIENDMQCALVMEYASGGDLDAFLRWQQESTRPGLTDILAGEVVQCHMMQLVSVTTSHQPMLLEQFAERIKDHQIATLSELVSPLPNRPSCSGNGSRDHIPAPTSPKQAQPEAENARQLFFENQVQLHFILHQIKTSLQLIPAQAAARRNKEGIDEERSRAAVFLDFDDNTPRVSASESSSDYSCERQLFPVENMQPASPSTRQRSESLEFSVAAVKLSPPRPRAQSSQYVIEVANLTPSV
ncbi:unnamed protein product [Phytophthora lilii]|uniref:Unnamed protein product n=1 Tax=Phytophthora lilii TaxID=2077276 RepID=A0A9W6TK06_9STRA|nr:unnamed protein product [Phytophthora lilii]